MSEQAQSPLVLIDWGQLRTRSDVLSISEHALLGHINLRATPENQQLMDSLQGLLGAALPTNNNTFTVAGETTALWLGPDEWLIITTQDVVQPLLAEYRKALGNTFSSLTDISGGNTVIDINGSAARDLLAKGSPIEFHPSVFGVGQCAQTLMAKTAVCVYQYSEAPGYRIIVRRSFADYLAAWLLDASREFES